MALTSQIRNVVRRESGHMTSQSRRVVLCATGAVAAPIAVMSLYLTFSRWPSRIFTTSSDYIFIGLSLAAGAAAICLLPFKASSRAAIILPYILVVGWLLVMFSFMFVGVIFDDWL